MNAQLTFPYLRAGAGPSDGSGGLCAMQVISWENGDVRITDFPACSDPMLARLVQQVNDALADSDGFLSGEDSLIALELGHMTVGTSGHGLSDFDLRCVYVRVACMIVRKVVHLDGSGLAAACIDAVELWVNAPTRENLEGVRGAVAAVKVPQDSARNAAVAASDAARYAARNAAAAWGSAWVAWAAADAVRDAADALAEAALVVRDAAESGVALDAFQHFLVEATREAILIFKELTGVDDVAVAPEVTADSCQRMVAVTA